MAFVHDVARVLALVSQGEMKLNRHGRLMMGCVSMLARQVILGPHGHRPRSESQGPELSLLVGLLGHAGMVGGDGERLVLAREAHDWLGQPAHVQIDRLRQIWWLEPAAGLRWMPRTRREESLDSHWHEVILETARWVCESSTAEWTPADSLLDHLKDQGLSEPNNAGANLPSVRRAVARQTATLARFLVRVVLPRLALVELEGPERSLRIRPTPEGATWLGAALARSDLWRNPPAGKAVELAIPSEGLRFEASQDPPLTVEPDLHLSLRIEAPALCTFELAHCADLIDPGPPARYRITRESLQQAMGWGYSVPDVIFCLTRYSDGHVPAPALAQLESWREEMHQIHCDPGYRLRIAAPPILDALWKREVFQRRTERFASGRDAWVSRTEAQELFRYLRRTGYALSVSQDPHDWPLQPPLRQPLPLAQLLVALRTYDQIRNRVPGLASLDLDELEQSLAASLPPQDLSGAERLIASHTVFLDQHLKRKPQEGDRAGEEPEEAAEADAAHEEKVPPLAGSDGADVDDPPGLKDRLQSAIQSASSVTLTYADTHGQVTQRRVRPLHVESRWGRRYLLAYCELRQDERHFRLDRIVELDGGGASPEGEGEGQGDALPGR